MRADVVIVGGGIVGASTAYHCVCEGLRTVLLDRGDVGRATDAGAGILSPETNSRDDPTSVRFGTAAVRYYGLLVAGGRVRGVVGAGRSYDAAAVVIAGGAWSRRLFDPLGIRLNVEPRRGQIIHLQLPDADTDRWTIVNAFRGHYIVPWPGGRIVVGATREAGSGFDPRLTVVGVREVLGEALRVAPGLAAAGVHEMRVGLRPLSSDMAPVLGAVPDLEGAYLATGHGPSGLQLGPYSGKLVCDLLSGRRPEVDLAPFDVARFASRS